MIDNKITYLENNHLRFKINVEQFFPVHQGGAVIDSEKAMKNVLHEFDKRKPPYKQNITSKTKTLQAKQYFCLVLH